MPDSHRPPLKLKPKVAPHLLIPVLMFGVSGLGFWVSRAEWATLNTNPWGWGMVAVLVAMVAFGVWYLVNILVLLVVVNETTITIRSLGGVKKIPRSDLTGMRLDAKGRLVPRVVLEYEVDGHNGFARIPMGYFDLGATARFMSYLDESSQSTKTGNAPISRSELWKVLRYLVGWLFVIAGANVILRALWASTPMGIMLQGAFGLGLVFASVFILRGRRKRKGANMG